VAFIQAGISMPEESTEEKPKTNYKVEIRIAE
jgi:hypothetical protein